jgi:putative pyruvate formate lyase activating enzyme
VERTLPVMWPRRPAATESLPPYVELARSGELERRAAEAHELLGERCVVCPRGCKVDRRADVKGLCAIGRYAVVASYFPHFGEENCLRGWKGSGTVFFSGCNLRCVFCLAPSTRVATVAGPRPIDEIFEEGLEEISVGDGRVRRPLNVQVYTVTGEAASATKAFCHHYRGDLIRLKPMSAPEVRLTPNHQVFAALRSAPDEIVKIVAGDLTADHYLVVPKRAVAANDVILDVAALLGLEPLRLARGRRRRTDLIRLVPALTSGRRSADVGAELRYHPAYVRTMRSRLAAGTLETRETIPLSLQVEDGVVRFAFEKRPGVPRHVALDESFAWLLGVYCAEGRVSVSRERPNSRRLIFTFGPHEKALVERTCALLEEIFRVRTHIVKRRTTLSVEVGKTSLAALFECLSGTGSTTKRVPAPLFSASDTVVRAFLDGYLAGDGTDTKTHLVANTVSEALAHGLYELGLCLGVLPSIHLWLPPKTKVIEDRRVRQSPLWYVKFKRDRLDAGDLTREKTAWKEVGEHFLVPIHRIERETYDGPVYNLEVDHSTHSYVAPAVAVGNCQNHDISWEVRGEQVTPARLGEMMLELQAIGCHNINWVTPEHVVPQILEALPLAVDGGLRLPIVYNTSSYDSHESLRLMDGVVDVYMPDFKLWTREASRRYLKRPDYADVARESVKEMHRQVGDLVLDERGLARRGLILRHLVMPELLAETEAILRFVADELGTDCYVNLMGQYYVSGKVGKDGEYTEIARGIHREEYERALELARELGLRLDARSVDDRHQLARAV